MPLSPMMVHYQQIKEKYKDCIVFYRLGDFYEMFFDDAIKASELLDLTLTGRDCGLSERAPMCGIPFHAAEAYISKLVAAGEKVAICEQLSLSTKGKELVDRQVIKVVTAGTVTDEYIDEKTNNFIAAVYVGDNEAGFSWADITTGEFYAENFRGNSVMSDLTDKLVKIAPAEIVACEKAAKIFNASPLVVQGVLPKFLYLPESDFNENLALNALLKQLKTQSIGIFGFNTKDPSIKSSGALVSYLIETQKHALVNINGITVVNGDKLLMLDANTVRNLELVKTIRDGKKYGTLLWLLDKTKTSMGARKLQSFVLSPLGTAKDINYRLKGVETLYNDTLSRSALSDVLSGFKDVARISGKISNNNLLPADCLNLCASLGTLPEIKFMLSGFNCDILKDINSDIDDFSALVKLLDSAISRKECKTDGEYIKTGYNAELDELKNLSVNGKSAITELEKRERDKTGIKTLKIGYNRVFGYYIEVTNSFTSKVPYDYQRKQTLANAERYITDELKELEVKILSSEEKAVQLEAALYAEVKNVLCGYVPALKKASDAIATLDVLLSFATVSRERGYVKPSIEENTSRMEISEGRHPVVEATSDVRFVPNDCVLDNEENRMAIITGPNMAGKSTYMRQVAIITLMAHIGCFVPAKKAVIPLTDKIFTRIGASDSLTSNQSTFMVEMSETAYILKNATDKSLVLLDEIGRGTSTFDGLSIAWAVVEYIAGVLRAKTLFATHYHELSELEGTLPGVKNYKITVKEMQGSFVFLRKIMRGSANKSFGIEVAELAGVDKKITSRAKEILGSLEKADITRGQEKTYAAEDDEKTLPQYSETERIIKDIDINNLSPMQAFSILGDLKEKLTEK